MMTTIVFLGLRALHVLAAAIWIGSATFLAAVVLPSIESAGPAGGHVMAGVNARNGTFVGVFAFVTVLSGTYLLWRFTGGFDGAVLATHAGRAFSIGGAAGILALIIGVIIGQMGGRLVQAGGALAKAADEAARQKLGGEMAVLRGRLKTLVRLVIVLQTIALVLMAVGHYI